jgi:hypothetical protein
VVLSADRFSRQTCARQQTVLELFKQEIVRSVMRRDNFAIQKHKKIVLFYIIYVYDHLLRQMLL